MSTCSSPIDRGASEGTGEAVAGAKEDDKDVVGGRWLFKEESSTEGEDNLWADIVDWEACQMEKE